VVVIDDPVKGRREAESAVSRKSTWDVWENTILPRLGPGAIVVLMQTRWHTDDLAGRLLDREPGLWRVLSIPALAEGPDDPLGREPGAELPSVRRRAPGYFRALSERMSPYVFRSVYQQRPTSARGSMFLRDRWRYWHRLPNGQLDLDGSRRDLRDQWRIVTVDLAGSTRTSADYTVAAAWALTQDGQLVLLDRVRERTAEADHWGLVRPLCERWKTTDVGVESTMIGTTLVRAAASAGLRPFDLHADRDKITRALPYSHLQRERRVWLPDGAPWLDEWIGEHADFPSAPHDDQVDAGAYAARLAVGEWNPGGDPVPDHSPTEPDPLANWDGSGGTDLDSAKW
jgi:predicted phage terminase large subunit-like protein